MVAPLALAVLLPACGEGGVAALAECEGEAARLELARAAIATEAMERFATDGVNVDPNSATPEQLEAFAELQNDLEAHDNMLFAQQQRCNALRGGNA